MPEVAVKKAANAALKAGDTLQAKAGAIREIIPWSLIENFEPRERERQLDPTPSVVCGVFCQG